MKNRSNFNSTYTYRLFEAKRTYQNPFFKCKIFPQLREQFAKYIFLSFFFILLLFECKCHDEKTTSTEKKKNDFHENQLCSKNVEFERCKLHFSSLFLQLFPKFNDILRRKHFVKTEILRDGVFFFFCEGMKSLFANDCSAE